MVRLLRCRHPRQHGYAETSFDEAERGRQMRDLVEPTQLDVLARQCRVDQRAIGAGAMYADEAMLGQVGPLDDLSLRERMIVAAEKHERILEQRLEGQVLVQGAGEVDAELDFSTLDRLQ